MKKKEKLKQIINLGAVPNNELLVSGLAPIHLAGLNIQGRFNCVLKNIADDPGQGCVTYFYKCTDQGGIGQVYNVGVSNCGSSGNFFSYII